MRRVQASQDSVVALVPKVVSSRDTNGRQLAIAARTGGTRGPVISAYQIRRNGEYRRILAPGSAPRPITRAYWPSMAPRWLRWVKWRRAGGLAVLAARPDEQQQQLAAVESALSSGDRLCAAQQERTFEAPAPATDARGWPGKCGSGCTQRLVQPFANNSWQRQQCPKLTTLDVYGSRMCTRTVSGICTSITLDRRPFGGHRGKAPAARGGVPCSATSVSALHVQARWLLQCGREFRGRIPASLLRGIPAIAIVLLAHHALTRTVQQRCVNVCLHQRHSTYRAVHSCHGPLSPPVLSGVTLCLAQRRIQPCLPPSEPAWPATGTPRGSSHAMPGMRSFPFALETSHRLTYPYSSAKAPYVVAILGADGCSAGELVTAAVTRLAGMAVVDHCSCPSSVLRPVWTPGGQSHSGVAIEEGRSPPPPDSGNALGRGAGSNGSEL
eukprot:scaffold3426_cov355-Prasinococcus_capsulatus_cf.AAC.9